MKLRSLLQVALTISIICVSYRAEAVSEFRAFIKGDENLFAGPGANYGAAPAAHATAGEELLVLGSSVGGGWTLVLKPDGGEGWLPTARLDLVRVTPSGLDDFAMLVDRRRRLATNWAFFLGLAGGSGPMGFGGGAAVSVNLAAEGLLGEKIDQFEIITGLNAYMGQATATTKRKVITEIPLALQWLGRFGPRGALLVGPRLGLSAMTDPTFTTGSRAVPFVFGVHARYYPDDVFGFYWESLVLYRSVQYVEQTVGMSFRF